MKDQELKDIFHAYRPRLSDEDAFMEMLSAQMDVADKKRQPTRIVPMYRKWLPWVAGVAAAVVVAVVVMVKEPWAPAAKPYVKSSLPEYYRPMCSSASFDDIVNEIEASGRQIEQAIAQL